MMSTLKLQQSQIGLSTIRNKSRRFGRQAPKENPAKIIIAQNRALTQIKYEQTHSFARTCNYTRNVHISYSMCCVYTCSYSMASHMTGSSTAMVPRWWSLTGLQSLNFPATCKLRSHAPSPYLGQSQVSKIYPSSPAFHYSLSYVTTLKMKQNKYMKSPSFHFHRRPDQPAQIYQVNSSSWISVRLFN